LISGYGLDLEWKAMAKKKHRILIIDDCKITVAGLKEYLSKKYYVLTACCGRDGIKKFNKDKDRIHLVLTDLIMPDSVGSQMITAIKEKAPEMPVIAITGWPHQNGVSASGLKADMILRKPFDMEELDQVIEEKITEKQKTQPSEVSNERKTQNPVD
jgi:DNA-binding NtrC family response regulator